MGGARWDSRPPAREAAATCRHRPAEHSCRPTCAGGRHIPRRQAASGPPRPPAPARRDYRPMEHLDRYEGEGIDDEFVDNLSEGDAVAARLAAERALARRDAAEGRLVGRRRGLPAALEGGCLWCARRGRRADCCVRGRGGGGCGKHKLRCRLQVGCSACAGNGHGACQMARWAACRAPAQPAKSVCLIA